VLDQATKIAAQSLMHFGERVDILPFFDFTLIYNRGAAFSFLAQGDGWQRWFLSSIAVAAIAFILWLMKTQPQESRRMMLALTLILAGAFGNLIDRLILGHVVDFLLFYWHPWYYPAFNIADMAITLGAILLIWDELQRWRQTRKSQRSGKSGPSDRSQP